jgi:hypothetical protein
MTRFKAEIKIIGINPFVFVPDKILKAIFKQARKEKGHIPITGTINGKPYQQTLVKYGGEWRLYINTTMLKNSPKRIGEILELTASFDPVTREHQPPAAWVSALNANADAKKIFEQLPPSRRKEIVRYLANLKTEESRSRNIVRAINFLRGIERFVGRDKP